MAHKFILADRHPALVEAWEHEFKNYSGFEFYTGDVFDKKADVIVSPANSFGFMDGGIDLAYSKKMGWHVQERVQKKIQEEFDGELLVGQSLIVETDFEQFPYLLSAPTMRVPLLLAGTPNVYLAAKAIFLTMKKYPDYTCLIPGLGTGCGSVFFSQCAQRMRMAYEDFYLGNYRFPKKLFEANLKHAEDITG